MSCTNDASGVYNIIPTRKWTRFNNNCSVNISTSVADLNMRRKAEVLKYQQSGNNMTQKQIWSAISKGIWNKKKSWASQTPEVSIPNTSNLLQTGNILLYSNTSEKCAYSTSSDVPGKPTKLCLDELIPLTMYRKQYTHKDGGNKWPYNKGKIKYTFN